MIATLSVYQWAIHSLTVNYMITVYDAQILKIGSEMIIHVELFKLCLYTTL